MKKIHAWTVLKKLPRNIFLELSKKYNFDYKIKKLPAHAVFLCIFESIITGLGSSLRTFATLFEKTKFQKRILHNKEENVSICHTAFHYRLNKIHFGYFRAIFEIVKKTFLDELIDKTQKRKSLIFDSTVVSFSGILLKTGFKTTGTGNKKQIKFTIAYGGIPIISECYTARKYHSENNALAETILSTEISKGYIVIFDRGLQRRLTYDQMQEKGIRFIGRLRSNYLIDTIKEVTPSPESNITKELEGYLYAKGKDKKTKYPYRVIHVNPDPKTDTRKEDKIKKGHASRKAKRAKNAGKTEEELYKEMQAEDIVLVTNIPPDVMSAEEIAEKYRERWGIEVFFRFLKQTLKFSHLVNRSENGIKSIMYIILTAAIILFVYRKLNDIEGYDDAQRHIAIDMLNGDVRLVIQTVPPLQGVFKLQFW